MQGLEKLKPLALLLLRVGLGIILVFHGYPKLFTHTHEAMQGFDHMGFPTYFVYIAGVIEFFGGCLDPVASGLRNAPARNIVKNYRNCGGMYAEMIGHLSQTHSIFSCRHFHYRILGDIISPLRPSVNRSHSATRTL